jgi:cytoskeletal protein RodZ
MRPASKNESHCGLFPKPSRSASLVWIEFFANSTFQSNGNSSAKVANHAVTSHDKPRVNAASSDASSLQAAPTGDTRRSANPTPTASAPSVLRSQPNHATASPQQTVSDKSNEAPSSTKLAMERCLSSSQCVQITHSFVTVFRDLNVSGE